MIEINLQELIRKIKESSIGIDEKFAEEYAHKLIENTDQRLMQNLSEWISDENISDIWIGKYCVNAIMSIRGDKDFLSALDAMNTYLVDEATGISMIWRRRR